MKTLIIFFGLLAILPAAYSASNDLLASQQYQREGTDGRLIIHFNRPVSYVSHFPATKGKSVKIRLNELTPPTISAKIEDKLIVSKNSTNPVSDILYEQENGQPGTLTIYFTRATEFDFKLNRARKSLLLKVKNIAPGSRITPQGKPPASTLSMHVIRLATSASPIDTTDQPALKNFHDYDIFTTESIYEGKKLYTLNLGYFYSPSVARANQKRLKAYYPYSWVDKIKPQRREQAESWFLNKRLKRISKKTTRNKIPEKIDILMERARQAMIDKNYRQAIRYFTRILQLGDSPYSKEAQELLGLARERNNQFAHATAEYETYLKLYPKGEDAERVRQRLLGLITARAAPKKKLDKGVKGVEPEWEFFGSLFQFYRYQITSTDSTSSVTTDNSLLSDIFFSGRKRGLEFSQRFSIAANNRYDFLDQQDASDSRVHTLYYDIARRDDSYAGRIGRQTHSSDGVLGRFDGLILHKRYATNRKLNLLAGYPVEQSRQDGINTERSFYAASIDFESLYKDTDFNFYYIEQNNGSFTDRNAVGTQVKYIDSHRSYFAMLDYDIFFSALNQITFIGNWRNQQNSSINIIADYRRSPLLTTNNALIGQTVTGLEQLSLSYTSDQIYQFARDRTTTYSSITLSASTHLSEHYQLTGDISFSSLDGTPASAGVAETQGTGTESFYNANLVINNFFSKSDITIFGARYGNTNTSDIIQLNFSSNFNIQRKWRLNPRLVIDTRDNTNGSSRTSWKPRFIMSYRSSRSWKFELDVGYETTSISNSATTDSEDNLYVFAGYIYDF